MLELSGMGSVLRGIGFLYWLLALGALALALRYGKGGRGKVIWTVVAIAVFGYLPGKAMVEQHRRNAYEKEAWAYFKKLCDEKSGEKIYKTFTGVKSVLVVKPLPPATERDLFDQFWMGDPYSNATPVSDRDISKAETLLRDVDLFGSRSAGFDFVEIQRIRDGGNLFERVAPNPTDWSRHQISNTSQKTSRFAVGWEDISKPEDRKFWIAGSRLTVIDLTDYSVVGERIGYLIESGFGSTAGQRRPWLAARGIGPNGRACPATDTFSDRLFILKVLKPVKE